MTRRQLPVLRTSIEPSPDHAPAITRRDLGRLLGASAVLAGAGCGGRPSGVITTASEVAPESTPGVPLEYATSMVIDGFATGLLALSRDGRPVKLEGNPDHPASRGATDVFHQAAILGLYDPDRLEAPRRRGRPSSWEGTWGWIASLPPTTRLWLIAYPQSSPQLAAIIEAVRRRFPATRVVFDSPAHRGAVYRAAERVFGRALEAQVDFAAAERLVCLDADPASGMPMSAAWSRDIASARRLTGPQGSMSRIYVAAPGPSAISSIADHHLRVRGSEVPALAAALWLALDGRPIDRLAGPHAGAIRSIARDLESHRGRSLIVAGEGQPEATHVLVHLLNDRLGNSDRTVRYTEPALLRPAAAADLDEFAAAARAGEVDVAVVLEANPVYTAPAALDIGGALAAAGVAAHLTLHANETSSRCDLVLPMAHFLESWGDARAYDGTISMIQPLIEPLWQGRTAAQLLAGFAGSLDAADRALLENHWMPRLSGDPERAWREILRRGLVAGSGFAPVTVSARQVAAEIIAKIAPQPAVAGTLEVELPLSSSVHDGRFANNGWLLELPHLHTKITWDNAALLAAATADRLGVSSGDRVELAAGGRKIIAPVLVTPGIAEGVAILELGYGRRGEERTGRGVGVDAYPLLGREDRARAVATVRRVAGRHAFARSQLYFDQHEREIALHHRLESYRADPDFSHSHRGPAPTLLGPGAAPGGDRFTGVPRWGMTIDTSICTGCSSCVVACQAENNIPVVGKKGVSDGRIMHWLRIDSYRSENEVIHQPMACQHCEHAPCEYVCPVYATTHSPDGLNEMTYNRCIGTRFCSNNCPYKVRRFNWFDYTETADTDPRNLQYNPDVSVRARGVMEKCTYCVQRIRRAQIAERVEGRAARGDGSAPEVRTACQQACPTGAIQFGDLRDAESPVSRWRREPRHYAVLHELGTRPRTIYLAKITNPNPELDSWSTSTQKL
jgi:molybdopterin-containing oxidoreductase family iron-sulfur binding subunit